jgi:hypothetical protein
LFSFTFFFYYNYFLEVIIINLTTSEYQLFIPCNEKDETYPAKVYECSYGKCLKAKESLVSGIIVQKFKGPIISWKQITEDNIRYVLWVDDGKWMIPLSDAKYINHSCDPICIVNENFAVVAFTLNSYSSLESSES